MRGMPRPESAAFTDDARGRRRERVNAKIRTDKSMPDDALSLHWTGPQPRLRRSLALPVTSAAQPSWDIAHDRAARTRVSASARKKPLPPAPPPHSPRRSPRRSPRTPRGTAPQVRPAQPPTTGALARLARDLPLAGELGWLALSAAPGAPSLALADTLSDIRSRMSSRQRVEGATPRPWHDSSRALGMALPKLEMLAGPPVQIEQLLDVDTLLPSLAPGEPPNPYR